MTEIELRASVVAAALAEVGSSDPRLYWKDAASFPPPYPKEWCGAFALFCLHQADLALDVKWRIGFGFLYRLSTTKKPKLGDVAYFNRFQHHSIVRDVVLERKVFRAINGNGKGGKVTLGTSQPFKNAAAFYSIGRFIKQACPP